MKPYQTTKGVPKNELLFVRYGGLSLVRQRKEKSIGLDPEFHSPPANRGIYAFVYPYIEHFLVSENRFKMGMKKFRYTGKLWCHFNELAYKLGFGIEYKESWVLVTYENFKILFKEIMKEDRKTLIHDKDNYDKNYIIDPYKRGLCNGMWNMSKDHLEVFIVDKI